MYNFCALILAVVTNALGYERYEGSQVWRLFPTNTEQRDVLRKLEGSLDIWRFGVGELPVDIRTDIRNNGSLFEVIKAQNIKHELLIENLTPLIEADMGLVEKARAAGAMSWDNFHSYDTILQWLEQISSEHNDISEIIDIGKSTEGRALKVIRIGIGSGCKRGHWIDGGFHAREWAVHSTVTWIINELLTNNKAYTELLTNLDFYILPVLNPDGYEFSRSDERMWRKTRSITPNPDCPGVDPNRNWDAGFGGLGSSTEPCTEVYCGPNAFSEPETEAMRKFIVERRNVAWRMYTSLHSAAQCIVFPWGYKDELPPDHEELLRLGNEAADAVVKVNGTTFRVGSSTQIFGLNSGGSDDWAKLSGIFKYSYTFELRDGPQHHIMPPEEIVPCAQETWQGLLVTAKFAQSL